MDHRVREIEQELKTQSQAARRLPFLRELGALLYADNTTRALEALNEALPIAQSISDTVSSADIYRNLGRCYYTLGKIEQARQCFAESKILFEVLKDHRGSIGALVGLASCALWEGNNVKAVELYTKTIELCEQYNEHLQLAISLNGIGSAYQNLGYYDKALSSLFRALPLQEKEKIPRFYANILNAIGALYIYLEEYDNALHYYTQALHSLEHTNYQRDKHLALLSISEAYYKAENYEKARTTAEHTLELVQQSGDNDNIAFALTLLGGIHIGLEDYHKALHYVQQAWDITAQLEESLAQVDVLLYIGTIYEKTGRYDDALTTLFKVLPIANATDNLHLHYEVHELIAQVYEKMGNDKEALYHHKKFAALRLETEGKHKQKAIAEMQALFDVEKARKEAELHRRNNEEISRINKALEEKNVQLSNTNQSLIDLNNEKNEFLSIVAHDLKNPLGQILGLAQLVRDDTSLSQAEIAEFSSDIVVSSQRMFELITNLLDINAIEQGKIRIDLSDFDIGSLVQRIVQAYVHKARQKNITLHCWVPEHPLFVYADPALTIQILDNLISNAVKYSPHGKNIWIDIQPSGKTRNGKDICKHYSGSAHPVVCVAIRDEGPGISDEDQKKLFGKFARLSAKPTGGEHSTGLGLSIVKKLVEAMNGCVWCTSNEGEGATFTAAFVQSSETD